ncbi:ABC transporter permease [Acidiferrimicrobium sp. IK]|uniref:ABC transporter permease n=1 Tax=Acidiferrimicrobium sp. IK TaxID=2871700 RepID=UPI0021CB6491|nr:ABC transporter permease [Acidiferrimicrobium sp. IK]MCU4183178.1 ABC transporter permease [Acidiferrimicrobium sp. IK]
MTSVVLPGAGPDLPDGPGVAVAPGDAPEKRPSLLGVVVPPLLLSAAVVGVWYLFSYVILKPSRRFLLPPPQTVIHTSFLEWNNLHPLLQSLALTAKAAGLGLAISILLGFAIAVAMSQAKAIERSVFPWAVVVQTVPILALVPIIGFMFGYNFRSRVLVCVIIAIFPIITNTLFGLQSVEEGPHDLFTLQGVSRWTRLWKLQFPAALPNVFTGLRISAGLSVIGAIVGDFFFTQGQPGLGILINTYLNRLETPQMYGDVILSSLLGIFAFLMVGAVSKRVIGAWYDSARGRAA